MLPSLCHLPSRELSHGPASISLSQDLGRHRLEPRLLPMVDCHEVCPGRLPPDLRLAPLSKNYVEEESVEIKVYLIFTVSHQSSHIHTKSNKPNRYIK